MAASAIRPVSFIIGLLCSSVLAVDDLGLGNGTIDVSIDSFDIKLVKTSGTLASLKPTGAAFDYLPYDLMLEGSRLEVGEYQWGDIVLRYRTNGTETWTDANSAKNRSAVASTNSTALLDSDLTLTLSSSPLLVQREWFDIDGDLGLKFTLQNNGSDVIEVGVLGFPAALNNIFTGRSSSDTFENCSLMDPYIGLDAGYLQVTPLSGTQPALVITPLYNTSFEGYGFLSESSRTATKIQTNSWEGLYQWLAHTKAYAEDEWANADPWNEPTSATINPGESRTHGLRFSLAHEGVRGIANTARKAGNPTAISIPGYIFPRDTNATLQLQYQAEVANMSTAPDGAFSVSDVGNQTYSIMANDDTWGRVRLTIQYRDGKQQTVHYYITKPASEAISDLGQHLTNDQWFAPESDPFGRNPSVMGYDHDLGAIIEQLPRVKIAGLSDECGAGGYTAAAIKQTFQPDAEEIAKIESFINTTLFGSIQDQDFAVKRSVFYYEPDLVPDYNYSTQYDWSKASDQAYAYEIDRAYNYVWPAATYWALYRVARAFPSLVEVHDWNWYLSQSFKTTMRGLQSDIGYWDAGLMGETVFGEILTDLGREDWTSEADQLTAKMQERLDVWLSEAVPFGSEQAWDSTGQEGVYFWSRYFGETTLKNKTQNAVLAYMPTIPHWAYNGNARRYWDFGVAGKVTTVERQIHHYGSGLNALVALSAFRDDPTDSYLLRVGYGGTSGPLSNIGQDGFASCAMHGFPQNLYWDAYSGDYGPNFVGLTLGSGTYLVEDESLGLVAYGGILTMQDNATTVQVRDSVRQKAFVGPLGVEISIDAGVLESFTYDTQAQTVSLTLSYLEGLTEPESIVVWVKTPAADTQAGTASEFEVTIGGQSAERERLGWKIPFGEGNTTVVVSKAATETKL